MRAGKHAEDLELVRAILRGDEAAWRSFVDQYSDRIYQTAYRWCRRRCRRTHCPVSRNLGLSLIDRIRGSICDEIRDGYVFILEQISKKSLPKYKGDCSLASFLYPVLNPSSEDKQPGGRVQYGYEQLYADYLRQRLGRLRLPKILKNLPREHQAVFEKICWGWTEAQICERLGLSPEEFQNIESQIEKALLNKGWKHYWYWLGFRAVREVPLSSPPSQEGDEPAEPEIPVADPSATPETAAAAREALSIFEQALGRLDARQRDLLELMYQHGLSARQIGEKLRMDPRKIYYDRDLALQQLQAELERAMPSSRPGVKLLRRLLKQYLGDRPDPG